MSQKHPEIRAFIDLMKLDERPSPLKSITLHPHDYAVLCERLKIQAHDPLSIFDQCVGGVQIYVSTNVPRGKPWFDPPDVIRRG